ncbi:MAG: superfamily II DNA/RNA helicase [Rhodothermales bacterium]|jgi:superfamily II DNA/RNA helicase
MKQLPTISSFAELSLLPALHKALSAHRYTQPMPVQACGLPPLLKGESAIVRARAGTGKTILFALPLLQAIESAAISRALVLAPTRELAQQLFEVIKTLGENCVGLRVACVVGGRSMDRQTADLSRSNVLVMTPGRAAKALKSGKLAGPDVGMVIVDEADLMLDAGNLETCQEILSSVVRKQTQLIFCSATFSDDIRNLWTQFRSNMTSIDIPTKTGNIGEVLEWAINTFPENHLQLSVEIIRQREVKSCIVFCNHRERVDEVAAGLCRAGLQAVPLHGNLDQHQRNKFMARFRDSEIGVLVATDLASRGIDIPGLELVINYDLPYEVTDYVHRYGRTGRAGESGIVVNFYNGKAVRRIQDIEARTGRVMQRSTTADILEGRRPQSVVAAGGGKGELTAASAKRLHINCGKRGGMNFGVLKKLLRDDCQLDLKREIIFMDIQDRFTLIGVYAAKVRPVRAILNRLSVGERKLVVQIREPKTAAAKAEKSTARIGKSKPSKVNKPRRPPASKAKTLEFDIGKGAGKARPARPARGKKRPGKKGKRRGSGGRP